MFNNKGIGMMKLLTLILLLPLSIQSDLLGQKVRQIEIINADRIQSAPKIGKGVQRLIGDVVLRHEDAIMKCDSAYVFPNHSMDAYNNVSIEQGDTLFLYGDKLHYVGETRIAQVRKNVKLVDNETVLHTEYLDYNRETEIAYYLNGGVINEGENELTSEQGHYNTKSEIFYFKDSVKIVNPDYDIFSDTLNYNTATKVAFFFGPTEIIGETNYIYCEGGWYDTDKDISLVDQNAFLRNEEGRMLKGDTLYYEREIGYGRANSNVELFDSAQNVIMKGNKGVYYEADQLATLSDSALMIQIEGIDSVFIHADTLKSIIDTAGTDNQKILLAYHKVKIYRADIQGMCDSLAYIEKDSVFHMFGAPILWADENQLTASKIEIYSKNQQLYQIKMNKIALLISQEDTVKYNQIRGKNMLGHFKDNDLIRLDVKGNGQTIYYAEDQGQIIGVNRSECSDLTIYLKDNRVSKVNYLVKPSGIYYPLSIFPKNLRYLDNFGWYDEWRPMNYLDVFRWK